MTAVSFPGGLDGGLDSLSGPPASPPPLPPGSPHPNVFCRGLPLAWGEGELAAVFGAYGELSSIRLVRHSLSKHSLG